MALGPLLNRNATFYLPLQPPRVTRRKGDVRATRQGVGGYRPGVPEVRNNVYNVEEIGTGVIAWVNKDWY